MSDNNYARMSVLTTLVYQEQAIFWQRFASLAALHAGVLVMATSTALQGRQWPRLLIEVAALLLALIWSLVQYTSLQYVDRWKPHFHDERVRLGLDVDKKFETDPRFSSTDLGSLVPVMVLFVCY